MTHAERDALAAKAGEVLVLAENEHFRCRCGYGERCQRRATQEDFLCDWCRGRNHDQACQEMMPGQYGPLIERNWAAGRALKGLGPYDDVPIIIERRGFFNPGSLA